MQVSRLHKRLMPESRAIVKTHRAGTHFPSPASAEEVSRAASVWAPLRHPVFREKFTYHYAGRDFRLTLFSTNVPSEISRALPAEYRRRPSVIHYPSSILQSAVVSYHRRAGSRPTISQKESWPTASATAANTNGGV